MSAPKEVWLSSDGILFKSVSINAYRAQVHSEDVRYVLAESVEAETASLRAQLAEATKQAETDRQHALRLFRDLHATSEERDALRSQLSEARAAQAWRPIETAPKDGSWVLLWSDRDGMSICAWLIRDIEWWHTNDNRDDLPLRGSDPTHWMPLPGAPAPEER